MRKPKVTPRQLDLWTYEMSGLYNSLEGEIIRIIIKRLNKGYDNILDWQAQKLYELGLFNDDVTKLLSEVTEVAESEITRIFEDVGVGAIQSVDSNMPYDPKPIPTNLDMVMRGYSNQVWEDVGNYINETLITTNYGIGTAQKAYTEVLNETQAMFNTGMYDFKQSLEKAVRGLAQKGIDSGMVDRGNNVWSLESYVRTVLKSTLGNTYDAVRKERMADYDVHTVVVTSHVGARKQCSRIQGNVVDLRPMEQLPADSEYRSIYDPYWQAEYETPGGHRGVNCRHLHIPFIPGVNTNNQPKYDSELNNEVAKTEQHKDESRGRSYDIKKGYMVSDAMGNSETSNYYKSMIGRRQKAMRKHLSENGEYLKRNYSREKVYTPLETLLKDFSYDK